MTILRVLKTKQYKKLDEMLLSRDYTKQDASAPSVDAKKAVEEAEKWLKWHGFPENNIVIE